MEITAYNGINKLKETVGDSKKRAKGVQAIIWFAEELNKLKGTGFAVQCGVVHGAFAHGAKRFQQIDILLVLENNVDEGDVFDFIIDNIIAGIYMEIPILFYLDVITPQKLELAIEHPMPRFRQMQEGIVFYGRDVLHQEPLNVQNFNRTIPLNKGGQGGC
jgi:hypothetical protein